MDVTSDAAAPRRCPDRIREEDEEIVEIEEQEDEACLVEFLRIRSMTLHKRLPLNPIARRIARPFSAPVVLYASSRRQHKTTARFVAGITNGVAAKISKNSGDWRTAVLQGLWYRHPKKASGERCCVVLSPQRSNDCPTG